MGKVKSVLFVCTGNSCRSVMAESLLKEYLKELDKEDIEVSSAGSSAVDGIGPTEETIEIMKDEGIDVSAFKSKRLTEELIKKADLILVMAAHHMDDVIRRVPGAASRTHLVKQYGLDSDDKACEDLDIDDPIGQPLSFYKDILGQIKKEAKRIAEIL